MESEPMEGLDQLLQDPYLEEESVRELAATRSLSTLAQVLDVIADVLSATQVGEMTVSFAIEEQVITEEWSYPGSVDSSSLCGDVFGHCTPFIRAGAQVPQG